MKRSPIVALFLVLAALWAPPVSGQQTEQTIRVFLDCQNAFCDQTFIRQEVHWIDWVRDRADADVQVLVTSQGTGGGGSRFELDFIGLRDFEGVGDQLAFSTSGDATSDDRRESLIRYLTLGLARYVARTPAGARVTVSVPRPTAGGPGGPRAQVADAQDDPWNFWVFRLGMSGNTNGQSSSSNTSFSGNFNAGRTTELWKFSLGGRASQSTRKLELSSGNEITIVRDSWNSDGLLVRSLGGQWALGLGARAGANTFLNQDLFWTIEPGVEYNFFPYSESSRRRMTVQYTLPVSGWDYTEETIFRVTEEQRVQHSLTANLGMNQPWGQVDVSLSGSQYLHDTDLYNVSLSGSTNVRLFKGFSFNVLGGYSWVSDQLFLPLSVLSDEDILTGRIARETSFNYFVFFGVSYSFGSIFNNIVNPRFGNGGGGGFFLGG